MVTTTNTDNLRSIKDIRDGIRDDGRRPAMAILYPANKNQKALADFLNDRHFGTVEDRFKVKKVSCPMLNKKELIRRTTFKEIRNADVLVVIRGGGNGMEIFDDEEVVRAFARLREEDDTLLCVGIGHSADRPAIYDIADVRATTPTELSVFFRDLILLDNDTMNAKWNKGCVQWPDTIQRKIRELGKETKLSIDRTEYQSKKIIEENVGENEMKINRWRIIAFLLGLILFVGGVYGFKYFNGIEKDFCKYVFIIGMLIFVVACMNGYEDERKEKKKENWQYVNWSDKEYLSDLQETTIDPGFNMLPYNIFHEED